VFFSMSQAVQLDAMLLTTADGKHISLGNCVRCCYGLLCSEQSLTDTDTSCSCLWNALRRGGSFLYEQSSDSVIGDS
jgi:hypothetical protein